MIVVLICSIYPQRQFWDVEAVTQWKLKDNASMRAQNFLKIIYKASIKFFIPYTILQGFISWCGCMQRSEGPKLVCPFACLLFVCSCILMKFTTPTRFGR